MNLYDKYEQKANRASFLITVLVLIVLLSFFEFNTSMEVQAEVEAPASYEVPVLDSRALFEEPTPVSYTPLLAPAPLRYLIYRLLLATQTTLTPHGATR